MPTKLEELLAEEWLVLPDRPQSVWLLRHGEASRHLGGFAYSKETAVLDAMRAQSVVLGHAALTWVMGKHGIFGACPNCRDDELYRILDAAKKLG